MTAALLSLACWYFHISRIADRLGYYTGRGVVDLCWTSLETVLELLKSRYLIFLYSDLMDQFEGSRRFDDHQWNSSAARESSRLIILKSHLNSTGHSACTSEVHDSWCARMFSNIETAAIQWRRPSVIWHIDLFRMIIFYHPLGVSIERSSLTLFLFLTICPYLLSLLACLLVCI